MKVLVIFATLTLFVSCSKPHPLDGKWKSNEAKSLKEMRNTPDIPEEFRNKFEDGFFGQLTVEVEFPYSRAIFDNPKGYEAHLMEWAEFKILEHKDNFWVLETFDASINDYRKSKIFIEGDCYYIFISKWQFKEYFCKID